MKNKNGILQDFTHENINTIRQFFLKGCKPVNEFKAGVEVEHFIVKKSNEDKSNSYDDRMSAAYEQVVLILNDFLSREDDGFSIQYESGKMTGFYNEKYSVSLEPAAQIEISIIPVKNIKEIEEIYIKFRKVMDAAADKYGYMVVTKGYHPFDKADNLALIPKKRYEFMNQYFKSSGNYGINMMRATASTQVSIDYKDEKDCAEKFRLACILSPVFSLLTENSDVFEGKTQQGHLLRARIWNDVDRDRCKIAPIPLLDAHIFENYAKLIYSLPAIVLFDGDMAIEAGGVPVSEYYKHTRIDEDTVRHLISMAFYDVRLKNYIEIRMADSMDIQGVLGYTAVIKGIFYSRKSMELLLNYFQHVNVADIDEAKMSLIDNGYDGLIYGRTARETVTKVLETAFGGCAPEERAYYRNLEG